MSCPALDANGPSWPQPLGDARPEALDQRVGARRQAAYQGRPIRMLQVDGYRTLATAEQVEAVLTEQRRGSRPVHPQHAGAEIGQQHAGERRRSVSSQLQNPQPSKWSSHGSTVTSTGGGRATPPPVASPYPRALPPTGPRLAPPPDRDGWSEVSIRRDPNVLKRSLCRNRPADLAPQTADRSSGSSAATPPVEPMFETYNRVRQFPAPAT